jgi:hypothetical protein
MSTSPFVEAAAPPHYQFALPSSSSSLSVNRNLQISHLAPSRKDAKFEMLFFLPLRLGAFARDIPRLIGARSAPYEDSDSDITLAKAQRRQVRKKKTILK